jgi:hypothetical protein
MQRFKKERRLKFERGQRMAFQYGAADRNGRFVYGANGTLTQAARWRDQAMRRVGGTEDRCALAFVSEARGHLAAVREFLDSARKGGCRLPA